MNTASKLTHTPGPWTAHLNTPDSIHNPDWQVLDSEGRCLIAEISWDRKEASIHPSKAEGNARLIAAAPEMLRVLEQAVTVLPDQHYPFLQLFKDVIAKAKGTNS